MGLRLGLAEVSTTYTTAEVGDGAGVPFFFFFFFFCSSLNLPTRKSTQISKRYKRPR